MTNDAITTWVTTAGNPVTKGTCIVDFKLPKIDKRMLVHKRVHVTTNHMNYDLIICSDSLRELGIDVLFSKNSVQHKHVRITI